MQKEVEIKGLKAPLTHFIIEEFVPHKEEYYLSIISNRETTSIHFSLFGGIYVEENWEKVKHLDVPVGESPVDLSTLLEGIEDEEKKKKISEFISALFRTFEELDFVLIEINPFVFDDNKNLQFLDVVAEVDGTAHFKNTRKWGKLEFPEPFGKVLLPEEKFVSELDEKTGASLKLTVLNKRGRIWNLVAGGGASVIYADTVSDLGLGKELGNYGEYSGAPNEEETYHYARTVLELATKYSDGRRKALLIGGAIANFTDVAKTFKGIIHALKEFREKLLANKFAIYVRRAGPNYKTGYKMMQDLAKSSSLPIHLFGPECPMTRIIPLAVEYIQQD